MPNSKIDDNRKPLLTAVSSADGDTPVRIEANPNTGALLVQSSSSLVIEEYNYISVGYPNATTETYTFKTGGGGGVTVAMLTIVYTDSTKSFISSVTKESI